MPNIARTEDHPDNPDWTRVHFDDGTVSPWAHDPGGGFRKQAAEVSAKLRGQAPNETQQSVDALAAPSQPAAMAATAPAPAPPVVAAPAPAPTPTEPAAPPQPIPRAEPAPGLIRAGENRQVTALTPESQAKIDEANAQAIEAQKAADDAANEAKTQQVNAEWLRLTEQEKANLAKVAEEEKRARDMEGRISRHTEALDEITKREPDPSRAFRDERGFYAFMAAFGDSLRNFGSALAGRGPVTDPGKTITAMIDRDVQLQTEQRALEYRNGLITADQLNAEREAVRAKLATAYKNLAETQLSRARTEQEKLALPAMVKHAEAMRAKAIADAAKATAQQETRIEEFGLPKPAGGSARWVPTDDESKALAALLGPKWEESYEKGMNSKVVAGENGATVQQALPMIHEMDQDLITLKAIQEANGGTIPTRGVINIPGPLQGTLARMGYKPGMNAEEANQLITGYVLRKARSYGGAVTAPDYENAEKEFGKSGDGLIRGIQRMRSAVANGTRQALVTHFRGNAQPVLDITMRAYGRTQGVEQPRVEAFEVQGGTDKGPEPAREKTLSERQAEEAAAEAERRRKLNEPAREEERKRRSILNIGAGRFGM